MPVSAQHSYATPQSYSAYDDGTDEQRDDFLPGERIGQPFDKGRKVKRRLFLLLVSASVGAGVWYGNPASWFETGLRWTEALSSAMSRTAPPATEKQQAAAPEPLPALAQALVSEAAPVPKNAPVIATAPVETAAVAAAESAEEGATAQAEPLPPPVVNPADPYQKRAVAVGLHPDLSRVLLAKMSDADYRNAGIAIQKAVKETADGAVLVWPVKPKPEMALFEVHFVAGVSADCRRYVVRVTKDGWLTTALPMEKCGVKQVAVKKG